MLEEGAEAGYIILPLEEDEYKELVASGDLEPDAEPQVEEKEEEDLEPAECYNFSSWKEGSCVIQGNKPCLFKTNLRACPIYLDKTAETLRRASLPKNERRRFNSLPTVKR